ncbi:MAG: ATP-dependent DNA helicase RecG, partial [Roseburia sp.]|nr:ATP-dependent DNA helicase RecG [Roseburia sp.]
NDGEMPSELNSTEKLFEKHSSKPYNPKLANVFFKSGMIEAWGRGFDKIKEACAKYDGRLPEYNISASGIMVLCKACDKYMELLNNKNLYLGQSDQDNDQDVTKMIIVFCKRPHSAKEIMDYVKINDRSFFRRHYLNPMIKTGQLKMTIPDKPKSGNQKYYV